MTRLEALKKCEAMLLHEGYLGALDPCVKEAFGEAYHGGSAAMLLQNASTGPAAPGYSTRLSPAVALIELLLPGQAYLLGRGKVRPAEPDFGCVIFPDGDGEGEPVGAGEDSGDLATAVVLALLRALIWKESLG